MRLAIALVFALAAACSGKQTEPPPSCAEIAQHGVDAMVKQAQGRIANAPLSDDARATAEQRNQKLIDMGPRLRAVITNRCTDDKWSAPVVSCYRKATTLDEMRACRKQLTAEQQDKLQRAELDLLAGPAAPAGLGSPSLPPDPRIMQLRQQRNELMKQLVTASETDKPALQAQIDALTKQLAPLE